MRSALNIFMALLVFCTFTASASDAYAGDPVDVKVRTIAASTSGSGFDPQLKSLQGQLTKAFRGYKSFKLVATRNARLDERKSKTIPLPNGSQLVLTYHGSEGKLAKLKFELVGKMSTMLRVSRGGTFFTAGMDYEDGILIIAITVR